MGKTDFYENYIRTLLNSADIQVNGSRTWDIAVHDNAFYKIIFKHGSLGLGESYMNGLWDCPALDELMYRIINADLASSISLNFQTFLYGLKSKVFNRQSIKRSKAVAKVHYDVGNDLYENMLDSRMIYTCAYWKGANNLDEAQENKLDLICRKLDLTPGEKVLDIGCGWGGFAKFAADNYQVQVIGITISKEQAYLAKRNCEKSSVEVLLEDYRNIYGSFDKIVSIGMFEHVGYKNYDNYMRVIHRLLKKNGLFLLHCIGSSRSVTKADPWINKYIFPNGMIPSATQISKAIEGKFILEDWHNFGSFYDRTLMAWRERFILSWSKLKARYDERFYRMWIYYLSCSAASFRAKNNNLWQIVLSREEDDLVYESIR